MTLPFLTFQPSTATSAVWLRRGGPGIMRGVPSPTCLHSAANRGAGDRSSKSAAGAHGIAHESAAELGRVLVVDDESLIRRTLALFLTRAGFAAVAVESGEEALKWLQEGEVCDLLITDQSMPGMTGCELISAARNFRPDLPILLVSGYDMSGGAERLPAGVPLLRKPVERAAFLGWVSALLNLAGDEGGESV